MSSLEARDTVDRRSESPPSVNRPSRFRTWEERVIRYRSPGGARWLFTPRKRVRLPPPTYFFGPAPRSETSSVGDNEHMAELSDSETSDADSGVNSVSGIVPVKYDLAPHSEMHLIIGNLYRTALQVEHTPIAQYHQFLEAVATVYLHRLTFSLRLPDHIWTRTILSFFPNTSFWNKRKNWVIEYGHDKRFCTFMWRIRHCVDRYMYTASE